MPEPNDKELHDWVRQTLHNYRPAYNPQDWAALQRKLWYTQWWFKGTLGMMALLAALAIFWWHSLKDLVSSGQLEPPVEEPVYMADKKPEAATPVDADLQVDTSGLVTAENKKPAVPTTKIQHINSVPLAYKRQPLELPGKANKQLEELSLPNYSPEESSIRMQMHTGKFGSDSTAYQVFTRNFHRWGDAVIVCDLTTSMYPYTTQLFTWFQGQGNRRNSLGMVFFTDCDSVGRETQPLQNTGQMFVTTGLTTNQVLPHMIKAARNTVNNHQSEENDVEALLFAQQQFPQARHLILLADNSSKVKDMPLLEKIHKPVHVILCRAPGDSTQAFQPEYLEIAARTGGSIHTLEDDLAPEAIKSGTWIRVGQRYYRYHARTGQFKLSTFRHRPKRYLGLFWL